MPRLYLFTRYPSPGATKTRLIPALGAAGAARLHRRLVQRTLSSLRRLQRKSGVDCRVRYTGTDATGMESWLGLGWLCEPQGEGDLGQRMAAAIAEGATDGPVVLIGSDCPDLTVDHLQAAFSALEQHDLVLGPATDGGYWLIGLRRPCPELFVGVEWGTERVLARTLVIAADLGLRVRQLEPLRDIDRPADLVTLALPPLTSVIVPVLNEAAALPATLTSIGSEAEVIVVDGGSRDATRAIALEHGATLLATAPGRARQMNAGAAAASGEVLLFLHGDTRLPEAWESRLRQGLEQPRTIATAFRLAIDDPRRRFRWLEAAVTLRSRWLGLPYGDQALALTRDSFEAVGGFPDLPLLEDYELVRALRHRGRIELLPSAVTTSARRWQHLGLGRTTLINQAVLLGWHLGVPADRLARFYRQARQSRVKR